MRRVLPMAIAIGVGLILLVDRFVTNVYLNRLGFFFLDTAVIVGAFALILGYINVLTTHLEKIQARQKGWPYSCVLVIFSVIVLAAGAPGISSPLLRQLFNYVQYPLQATVASLLVFFVASAAFRALRIRGFDALLFVVVAVIVLVGQIPFLDQLTAIKDWILGVPALAGMRGLILGVALGTTVTGLRLLMGIDRPYAE